MKTPTDPLHGQGWLVYRRLLRCARPYWWALSVAVIGLIVFGLSEPAIVALMKPMLDGSFVERDPQVIKWVPLYIVGLALLRMVSGFTQRYAMEWMARNVIRDLRQQVFEQLLRLPVRFFHHNAAGNLISRVTYDVEQMAGAGADSLSVMVRDSVTILGLVSWMFYLNWRLALMFVVIGPLIALTMIVMSRRFRYLSGRLQQSLGELTQATEEIVEGHLETRVFGAQERESHHFSRLNQRNRGLRLKWVLADAIGSNAVLLLVTLALAVTLYAAATFAANDRTTVGGFVSFMMAMGMLQGPIKRLTKTNSVLQRGITAAHSVFGLLSEAPEVDQGTRVLRRCRGEIRYRDVSFGYRPEQPVLRGVSFDLQPGSTVALVGPSGAGKTSLAHLLVRYHDPTQGCITLDGHDLRAYTLASLRQQIALVGQQVVLFNNTVAGNIAYGAPDSDEQAIWQALEQANAAEFVRGLPQGIATNIGDNGIRLSGGQRQRLAIARALLKDAPILILDEATSSLDSTSEALVQEALARLMARRTTLVIAHRLSTIESADSILVLDEGRVVDQGSHAELLARGGLYEQLHRQQFARQPAVPVQTGSPRAQPDSGATGDQRER